MISIKSPTETTAAILNNGTNAITLDASNNADFVGNLNLATGREFSIDGIQILPNSFSVASSAEMLALTTAKQRDICIVAPIKKTYILGGTDYSTIGVTGWWEIATSGGATGGTENFVFYENQKTITANYTITSGNNASTTGPVTISEGVVINVPDGSRWTII